MRRQYGYDIRSHIRGGVAFDVKPQNNVGQPLNGENAQNNKREHGLGILIFLRRRFSGYPTRARITRANGVSFGDRVFSFSYTRRLFQNPTAVSLTHVLNCSRAAPRATLTPLPFWDSVSQWRFQLVLFKIPRRFYICLVIYFIWSFFFVRGTVLGRKEPRAHYCLPLARHLFKTNTIPN